MDTVLANTYFPFHIRDLLYDHIVLQIVDPVPGDSCELSVRPRWLLMRNVPTFEEDAGFTELETYCAGDLQATVQCVGGIPSRSCVSNAIVPRSAVYGKTKSRALVRSRRHTMTLFWACENTGCEV
jgi:hypothetical protein